MNNTLRTVSKLVFLDSNNICAHFESDTKLGISTEILGKIGKYYKTEYTNENGDLLNLVYVNRQPKDEFNTVEYDDNNDPLNSPEIGYTYDSTRNAFIPPCPMDGYILNEETFTWNPDPTRTYDLHNDGNLYRWDTEINAWIPTW